MAAVNLTAVMDGIAAQVLATGQVRESYAWPPDTVVVPSCLVDLPDRIEIGTTFGRGSDTLELPVFLLIDQRFTKDSRDTLSAFIDGGLEDVCAAIEGPHDWGTAHVMEVEPTTTSVAGTVYIALKLNLEVST